jgi:hypothetical protein
MAVCPRCGRQDSISKVSALLALGYSPAAPKTDEEQAALPAGGEDPAPAEAVSAHLAQRLSIPDEQWLEIEHQDAALGARPGYRTNRGLAILLCALAGYFLVKQLDLGWAWLGLLVGMLVGGFFFNVLPNRVLKKARLAARLAREAAQRRYAALYYCAQDDLVFLPEEGRSAPPEQMIDLLYRG